MPEWANEIIEKIQARRWKFAPDTSPAEGVCMQWANRMNTWCTEIVQKAAEQHKDGWISVSDHLPECEQEVWIQTKHGVITTAIYEDGKMTADDSEALFTSRRLFKNVYGIKEARRMCKASLENIAKSICKEAGIVDKICTVHVFRKTFATRLAENGCPLEIIQELLGHSSASITSKHYVAKTKKRVRMEFERCMTA